MNGKAVENQSRLRFINIFVQHFKTVLKFDNLKLLETIFNLFDNGITFKAVLKFVSYVHKLHK